MLDDNDHKQIIINMENVVLKAFDQHRITEHRPMEQRLDRQDERLAKWAGGLVIVAFVLPFVLKFLFK